MMQKSLLRDIVFFLQNSADFGVKQIDEHHIAVIDIHSKDCVVLQMSEILPEVFYSLVHREL